VLKAFADFVPDFFDDGYQDDDVVSITSEHGSLDLTLCVADFRRARSTLSTEDSQPSLPQDVIDLVIEARNVAYSDQSPEAIRALDKAVEAFAERVGWEDEPIDPEDSHG